VGTSNYVRVVLGVAAWLASSVGAQSNSVSIYVDDGRPVDAAIQSLVDRYPIVITYEDPRYEYSRDIKDVTDAIRNPLAPPATRRTLVPRGGILQASYDVSVATGQPTDTGEALRRILESNDVGPAGGRFRVLESGGAFHVVPTAIKNAGGSWVAQASVLDTPITLNLQGQSGYALLEAITKEVSRVGGTNIGFGGQAINALVRHRGDVEANTEPAREVLMRMLHAISDRFIWRLFYDPSGKYYVLNLGVVAERPSESTPIFQLPPPRPGDPTPAFRLDAERPRD
jgi:hypothetical protein